MTTNTINTAELRKQAKLGNRTLVASATMLALLDRLEEAEHQRQMLMQAIADAALKGKVWNGEVPLDGPQLLMMCDDLACVALAASQQVRGEPVAYTYPEYLQALGQRPNVAQSMWSPEIREDGEVALYAAQPPAPAAEEGKAVLSRCDAGATDNRDAEDAANFRWLIEWGDMLKDEFRAKCGYKISEVRAAIAAAQAGKENDRG